MVADRFVLLLLHVRLDLANERAVARPRLPRLRRQILRVQHGLLALIERRLALLEVLAELLNLFSDLGPLLPKLLSDPLLDLVARIWCQNGGQSGAKWRKVSKSSEEMAVFGPSSGRRRSSSGRS